MKIANAVWHNFEAFQAFQEPRRDAPESQAYLPVAISVTVRASIGKASDIVSEGLLIQCLPGRPRPLSPLLPEQLGRRLGAAGGGRGLQKAKKTL